MTRKPVLTAVLISLFWSVAAASASQRPNVILISIDTLRPDHLGAYGYAKRTSPWVDAFRRESVLFRTVIASGSSTLVSHASIFTALAPQHHGALHSKSIPLAENFVTLTEVLRDDGYRTAAFVGGGQIAPEYGLNQGFEHYLVNDKASFSEIVDQATPYVEKWKNKPFFLFLHTYEVHHPYAPSPEDLKRFEPETTTSLPATIGIDLLVDVNWRGKQITDRDREHIVNTYDAEIYSVDRAFGKLVRELKRLGVYDNSVIVFTSDHGEEFGEHGIMGWHSHTLHDELLRIPLIVRFPQGANAGKEIGGLVRGVDIAPIILDIAGVPHPSQFDGFSLATALRRGRPPATAVLLLMDRGDNTQAQGLRTPDWKMFGGRVYDLRRDPRELNDLGAKHDTLRNGLTTHLQALLRQRPIPGTQSITPDEATLEALRSLGYIQ